MYPIYYSMYPIYYSMYPSNILLTPPIFFVNLTCDAMDTLSALPLRPWMVNCGVKHPFIFTCPCKVQLGAFQVSAHSKAPETVVK